MLAEPSLAAAPWLYAMMRGTSWHLLRCTRAIFACLLSFRTSFVRFLTFGFCRRYWILHAFGLISPLLWQTVALSNSYTMHRAAGTTRSLAINVETSVNSRTQSHCISDHGASVKKCSLIIEIHHDNPYVGNKEGWNESQTFSTKCSETTNVCTNVQ